MKLTKAEKKIYAELLDQFIQELTCNGCNDHEVKTKGYNKDELKVLADEVSGDDEEYEFLCKGIDKGRVTFIDFTLIQNLKDKLLED